MTTTNDLQGDEKPTSVEVETLKRRRSVENGGKDLCRLKRPTGELRLLYTNISNRPFLLFCCDVAQDDCSYSDFSGLMLNLGPSGMLLAFLLEESCSASAASSSPSSPSSIRDGYDPPTSTSSGDADGSVAAAASSLLRFRWSCA